MDRIFNEIKKAIEEEMRNAEAGPSPSGQRQQAGGRRAQEYAEWLKEEQDRLRGDRNVQPIEGQTISYDDDWEQQKQEREEAARQRRDERRQQRSGSQQRREDRQQRVDRRQQPTRQQPQQQQRSAHSASERRARSAYDQRSSGAAVRRRVQRMLSTNQGLRQAFLMREIVGKPLSLRDRDDHLISS
jgi:hypothetical protein